MLPLSALPLVSDDGVTLVDRRFLTVVDDLARQLARAGYRLADATRLHLDPDTLTVHDSLSSEWKERLAAVAPADDRPDRAATQLPDGGLPLRRLLVRAGVGELDGSAGLSGVLSQLERFDSDFEPAIAALRTGIDQIELVELSGRPSEFLERLGAV